MVNVIDEQVVHSQFGEGKVISQGDSLVEVEFSEAHGVRKFIYPAAFEEHLTISNTELQNNIKNELLQIQENKEAAKKERAQEIEDEREEKRKEVLAEKRAAAATKRATTQKAAKK